MDCGYGLIPYPVSHPMPHRKFYLVTSPGGEEGITDPNQNSQQNDSQADAPSNKFFLYRQKGLAFHLFYLVRELWLCTQIPSSYPASGGLTP